MLQQTQVNAVINHFNNWMNLFPDVKTLARTKEDKVLQAWQGLGYYSRARNILKAAKTIHSDFNQQLPNSRQELLGLPGIGEYTAGAILSLAYGQKAPLLDGNLIRVFSRLFQLNFLPTDNKEYKKQYWDIAEMWVQHGSPEKINEALMELGALLCKPKSPECSICPLQQHCHTYDTGDFESYPPKKKKKETNLFEGYILIIRHKNDVYMGESNFSFLQKLQVFPLLSSREKISKKLLLQHYRGLSIQSIREGTKVFSHAITNNKFKLKPVEILLDNKQETGILKNQIWVNKKEIQAYLISSMLKKAWNQLYD